MIVDPRKENKAALKKVNKESKYYISINMKMRKQSV